MDNNDVKHFSTDEAASLLAYLKQFSAEEIARLFESSSDFRVLRRYNPEELLLLKEIPDGAGIGLVLDTETTGKEDTDKIIELGVVAFAYNRDTGEVYGALDYYNGLEDPGMPIPPEATAVNGITDEMVQGKRIDDERVNAMAELADFCIAHNSGFDRPKTEARLPLFKNKAWACSFRQLDWDGEGIGSAKLDYIAYRRGFFYEAHRAYVDSLALLKVLSMPMASLEGRPALYGLLQSYQKPSHRVWAVNSPFDLKDELKKRKYRWSDGAKAGSEKAWYIDVEGDALEAELKWLKDNIYPRKAFALPVDKHDAFSRFSERNGTRETVYL